MLVKIINNEGKVLDELFAHAIPRVDETITIDQFNYRVRSVNWWVTAAKDFTVWVNVI